MISYAFSHSSIRCPLVDLEVVGSLLTGYVVSLYEMSINFIDVEIGSAVDTQPISTSHCISVVQLWQ